VIVFDFLQFDQSNLWFFILSAVGLVRERRFLPYVLVAVGNLVHGSLAAVVVAALILWHRMDLPAPKWVQLKDALGFFFIVVASVAPAPLQNLAICLGVLMVSMSFDAGALGVIPALLLLRQFVPHPAEIEILMGMAGIYWVAAEALRFAKSDKTGMIRASIETLANLGILYGLREIAMSWFEEPVMIGISTVFIVFCFVLALVLKFRSKGFWKFYRNSKQSLSSSLTVGNRFISPSVPWLQDVHPESLIDIEKSFDRLFVLVSVSLVLLSVIWVISRGGIN